MPKQVAKTRKLSGRRPGSKALERQSVVRDHCEECGALDPKVAKTLEHSEECITRVMCCRKCGYRWIRAYE